MLNFLTIICLKSRFFLVGEKFAEVEQGKAKGKGEQFGVVRQCYF